MELGYLPDPGDRLGMLDSQRFRAARVIVDIGMHLELPIPIDAGFHLGRRWGPRPRAGAPSRSTARWTMRLSGTSGTVTSAGRVRLRRTRWVGGCGLRRARTTSVVQGQPST